MGLELFEQSIYGKRHVDNRINPNYRSRGYTGYQIVSMSGIFDLSLITGLLPPAGYQSNDNLLGPSQPQLDSIGGLSFTSNGTHSLVNISYPGSPLYLARTSVINDNGAGVFSAIRETPEPTTAVLIVPTLLAFALFVRRRKVHAHKRV